MIGGRSRVGLASACALAALTGCFAGYSSAWHQNREAQRAGVERLQPSELQAGQARDAPARKMRVRVWATNKYRSETLQWKAHVRDVVDRANRVVGPALGLELEVAAAHPWS